MPSNPPALSRVLTGIVEDEVVALTQRLVRIPSVYRPGEAGANESAVARAVADWFRHEGFGIEIQEVAPSRPNIVGWLDGAARGRGRTLCFEGHTDVVTEGDHGEWTHDPWSAALRDGRIYGRGSADMKGGLAAAMVAAAALRRSGVPFSGRLLVAALVDEEGKMAGARHFMRTPLGRSVDAAIICEPEQNELCLEQRGVVWARIGVKGRMAHGAMPYAGVNPIVPLGFILAALPRVQQQVRRGVRRSPFLGTGSVTPTVCRAPVDGVPQNNVIPSRAEAVVDARLVPGLSHRTVLTALGRLARDTQARWPDTTVTVEVMEPPRPATRVGRTAPVVQALAWAVRSVTGRPPRFGGVPGSTDGTIFVMERRIPIVTYGPGKREVPHQVDEHVEVAELVEAARCYAAAALRYLS